MTWLEILILLIIAGVCGSIGQALGGTARGGFLADIALGFIGALFGLFMARGLHLPDVFSVGVGTMHFPILWSIIGAAIFVALLRMLAPAGRFAHR